MKSAYELAMERLEKESPSGPSLTDEQKAALAEADNQCTSRIAEKKILAEQEIQKNYGNPEACQTIQERLQTDIRLIESERDRKKKEIREQSK
ncbi:MAG: hypothetical protein C4527_02310 [Candidatus Omnitrophota bacterium]|jgi:hypothetical protein|nr:MAG: hypothetical protein C4527_02310 [Candidatus Omnitrophota bacterium]